MSMTLNAPVQLLAASDVKPETLLLSKGSILDTPFVSTTSRRPLYATHTKSETTVLYRIDVERNLQQVARIMWTGYGSLASPTESSRSPCLLMSQWEHPMDIDVWLTKAKGLFS